MKSRTAGGCSPGGRSTTSCSAYSACSRAEPPPVKNACSVCAASWITRSPSMRPGQPRSSASSRGVNMQSFTPREPIEGLGGGDVAAVARLETAGRSGATVFHHQVELQRGVLREVHEQVFDVLVQVLLRGRAEERRDERGAIAHRCAGRIRVERASGDVL